MTDGEGKFALEDLDAGLFFRLLVYKNGFAPLYTDGFVDPREGAVTITLTPHDLEHRDPGLVLHGKVVDAHGDPVARAWIEPIGQTLGKGRMLGQIEGADPLALSDEHGDFALGVAVPGESILLEIGATGFATRVSPWLPPGSEQHVVALGRGVTVTGRIVKDGQPLAGLEVGIVQADRGAEGFLGERTIGTGADGRFTFVNVGPADTWQIYGLMASFQRHGALTCHEARTGADETTIDVGTLEVAAGHRLAGRVVLSDGSALPENVRVLLDREEAWDAQTVVLGADGNFVFEGVPPEQVSLSLRLGGYKLSPRNESYDFVNHQGLIGRVEEDTAGIVVLLEPGIETHEVPKLDPDLWKRYEALEHAPLRGAPPDALPH